MEITKGNSGEGEGMFDEINNLLNVIKASEASKAELELNIKETETSLEKEENLETNLEGKKNLAGGSAENVESQQDDNSGENNKPENVPSDDVKEIVGILINEEEKTVNNDLEGKSDKIVEKSEEIEENNETVEEINKDLVEKCENTNDFSVETDDKNESLDEVPEEPKQNQEEPISSIVKNEEAASIDENISIKTEETLEKLSSEVKESNTLKDEAECSYVKVEVIEEDSKNIDEICPKVENVDDITQSSIKPEPSPDETELTESSIFSDVKFQKLEKFKNESSITSAVEIKQEQTEVDEKKGVKKGEIWVLVEMIREIMKIFKMVKNQNLDRLKLFQSQ